MIDDSYDSSINPRSNCAGRVGRSIGFLRERAGEHLVEPRRKFGRSAVIRGIGISWMFLMICSASSPGNSFSLVNSS